MKSVIVVHRHGARFPSAGQPGNKSFPSCDEFWQNHSMQLTPRGALQLHDFGVQLREYYSSLTSSDIHVFTSNTTRTIFSVMALLDGLCSGYSHCIQSGYTENHNYDPKTIVISVESKKHDSLFHLGKNESLEWKAKNIEESPELDFIERAYPDVKNLLDKLYTMGHCPNMDPVRSFKERISHITTYVNLVRYGDVHNSPVLVNKHGLELTQDERDMIIKLGNVIYGHRFRHHSGRKDMERGTALCSMLLDEICKRIQDEKSEGFYIYSCHDTTLLAIAAAFGINISCPDFASYFIFEIYHDGMMNVKFNPSPRSTKLEELNNLYWDKSEMFIDIQACQTKSFSIDDFTQRFSRKNYYRLPELLQCLINQIPTNLKLDPIVFSYFQHNGFWDDESIKEIFGRFDLPIPNISNFKLSFEEFSKLCC